MAAAVEQHYTRPDLLGAIRIALQEAGKDPTHLQPADLAPVDEFHIRGRQATLELANRIKPKPSDHILDIGSGLGGASRALAATYACHVTGIDLTEEYCRTARELAAWAGLGERVTYQHANALDLPFPEASFDIVWTQHVAMNIPDKAGLYREAHRVLKPGGIFAIYDVLQGAGGDVIFPVPWAREPSISYLVTPEELRDLLERAGFVIEHWQDTTAEGREWFTEMSRRFQGGSASPISFALLLGSEFKQMAANQRRNLEESRIALIETVCRKR